jgi:hypothetical protein
MGIYSRDNLASGLQNALDAALRRRDEYVKQDAARRDANVEAINNLVEGLAYAHEDELDDKKKKLLAEKAALQKAQEKAAQDVRAANERSLIAEQGMDGYKPGVVGSDYEQIMQGYRPAMPTRQPMIPVMHPAYMYADPENPEPSYNYWDAMQGIYRRNR